MISACRMRGFTRTFALLLAVLATVPIESPASAASTLRTALTRPIAVRGSVVMLPVHRRDAAEPWPEQATLRIEDGPALDARLVEIIAEPNRDPGWAGPPSQIRIDSPAGRTSRRPGGAVYLLAELPEDGDGTMRLDGQRLRPRWRDAPQWPGGDGEEPAMPWRAGPDRPDPDSPLEYWRWVLLADRLDLSAPDPSRYGRLGSLIARHYADLWLAGLERIESQSGGVALEAHLWLTRRCRDGDQAFACWAADPDELNTLLSDMLDFTRSDESAMQRTLDWCDTRARVLSWTESHGGDHVRLAFANRSFDTQVVRVEWQRADDPPLALEIEPAELERMRIERPALPESTYTGLTAPHEPTTRTLQIKSPQRAWSVDVGPRRVEVTPPGLTLATLRPTWDLPALDAGRGDASPRAIQPTHQTYLSLRRVGGQWEAFFEARRPSEAHADEPADLSEATALTDLPGVESVTLMLGSPADDPTSPRVVLTVPERGEWRLWSGKRDGMEVHRRSYADRWYCRIVLPESWIFGLEGAETTIGAVRSHADREGLATGPQPAVPWRIDPGRVHADFTAWDSPGR